MDITDRKMAELERARATDFLRAVINTTPNPVLVKDSDAKRARTLPDGQKILVGIVADITHESRRPPMPLELGWHPHSGIATVTVMLEGEIRFQETTGRDGVLPAGGVEWMRAGNGVWHTVRR